MARALKHYTLKGREYRHGDPIDSDDWASLPPRRKELLVATRFVELDELARPRGRPKGSRDRQPRKRRKEIA